MEKMDENSVLERDETRMMLASNVAVSVDTRRISWVLSDCCDAHRKRHCKHSMAHLFAVLLDPLPAL